MNPFKALLDRHFRNLVGKFRPTLKEGGEAAVRTSPVSCKHGSQSCRQARDDSGKGNASRRSSSSPRPSWNS